MRITSNNELKRGKSNREFRYKIFVMLEGTKTEPQYFNKLFDYDDFQNIELFLFEKEEDGFSSNPKIMTDYLVFLNNDYESFSYKEVIRNIRECLKIENRLNL